MDKIMCLNMDILKSAASLENEIEFLHSDCALLEDLWF